MQICQLTQPWEYDEVADLDWLPQSVRDAFSRFSDRANNIVAFKYINNGHIEGVGIGKLVQNELVIGHINVKDNARNNGIGSGLLNHFLEIATQHHVTCRLQVAPSNRKAQRLYGRFDFTAITPDEPQDSQTLWMARKPPNALAHP